MRTGFCCYPYESITLYFWLLCVSHLILHSVRAASYPRKVVDPSSSSPCMRLSLTQSTIRRSDFPSPLALVYIWVANFLLARERISQVHRRTLVSMLWIGVPDGFEGSSPIRNSRCCIPKATNPVCIHDLRPFGAYPSLQQLRPADSACRRLQRYCYQFSLRRCLRPDG